MKVVLVTLLICLSLAPIFVQKGLYNISYGDMAFTENGEVREYKIEDDYFEAMIPVLHPDQDVLAGWYLAYKIPQNGNSAPLIEQLVRLHGSPLNKNDPVVRWDLGGKKHVDAGFDIWHDRFWVIYANDEFAQAFNQTKLSPEDGTDIKLNRYMKKRLMNPYPINGSQTREQQIEILKESINLAERFNQPDLKTQRELTLLAIFLEMSRTELLDARTLDEIEIYARSLGQEDAVSQFALNQSNLQSELEDQKRKQDLALLKKHLDMSLTKVLDQKLLDEIFTTARNMGKEELIAIYEQNQVNLKLKLASEEEKRKQDIAKAEKFWIGNTYIFSTSEIYGGSSSRYLIKDNHKATLEYSSYYNYNGEKGPSSYRTEELTWEIDEFDTSILKLSDDYKLVNKDGKVSRRNK